MGKKIAGGLLGCLAMLIVLAPAALAAPRFTVNFSNNENGGGSQDSYASVYDGDGSPDGTSVELLRGGAVIASGTGGEWQEPYVLVQSLAPGDQLHYVGNGVDRTWTWDGLPSLDPTTACVGSSSFSGSVNAAIGSENSDTSWFYGDVYPPYLGGSAYPEPLTDTQKADGKGGYTVTTKSAIPADAFISVGTSHEVDDARVRTTNMRKATECTTPPAPAAAPAPAPAPAPPAKVSVFTPPTAAQLFAALQTFMGTQATQFGQMDLTEVLGNGSVIVPFQFLVAGNVVFSWNVANGATGRTVATIASKKHKKAKAKKAKKPITVARGAKALKAPGTANVKLKLTKAGKKLLRKSKSMRLSFTATFTPAAGGKPQTTSTRFTLKKHPKHSKRNKRK